MKNKISHLSFRVLGGLFAFALGCTGVTANSPPNPNTPTLWRVVDVFTNTIEGFRVFNWTSTIDFEGELDAEIASQGGRWIIKQARRLVDADGNMAGIGINGKVGIGSKFDNGTTDPATALEVDGNVTAEYYEGDGSRLTGIDTYWDHDSTDDSLSYTDGNVGIGLTDPSEALEVTGDVRVNGELKFGETTGIQSPSANEMTTDDDFLFDGGEVTLDEGDFTVSGGDFTVDGGSTTSSLESDHVYLGSNAGDTIYLRENTLTGRYIQAKDSNGLQFRTKETTIRLFVGDTGNIGIGTITPAYKLEVNGKIGIKGTQMIYLPDQTDFTGTMVVGNGGGSLSHGGGDEGRYNTLVGFDAGLDIATQKSVTAIGAYSATSNSGDNVTAIGHNSASNNSGDNVTAIGDNSASNNTRSNVTALGYNAEPDKDNQVVLGDTNVVEVKTSGKIISDETEIGDSNNTVVTKGYVDTLAGGVNTDTLADLNCAEDKIAKRNGGVWVCADDTDTDTDIYWTGTATNLVPTTARTSLGLNSLASASLNCSPDQIPKFDGGNWVCADDEVASGTGTETACTTVTSVSYTTEIQTLSCTGDLKITDALIDWQTNPGVFRSWLGTTITEDKTSATTNCMGKNCRLQINCCY